MKSIKLLFCLVWIGHLCPAQTVNDPYVVATWKGFAEAAVTYTFDDNTPKQYAVAIPMFNEFDFNATFYPVVNWEPNWKIFQEAVLAGHEVGSHTLSHPHLSNLSDSMQQIELSLSQRIINDHLPAQRCLTIAYAYCDPSDHALTPRYYLAARHCQGYTEKSTPENIFFVSSIICGDQGSIKTADDFKNIAESAALTHGWNVYLLHGIDDDGGYSPVSSEVLRESLNYLDRHREKYWVATFHDVVLYIKERNAASVKEIAHQTDTIKVTLSDNLDDNVYNHPLTIRRNLPAQWSGAQVFQNGESIPALIRDTERGKYIEFDAIPDKGIIFLISGNKPAEIRTSPKRKCT